MPSTGDALLCCRRLISACYAGAGSIDVHDRAVHAGRAMIHFVSVAGQIRDPSAIPAID
jgi:hypothetical protein